MSKQGMGRGGRSGFSTTRWSLIARAADSRNPEGARDALEALCSRYWRPVYAYIRRRGFREEDACDLTQGFFADLLQRQSHKVADPERGRFRSFLLTGAANYLANVQERAVALKRGGGQAPLELDRDEPAWQLEGADGLRPDKLYDLRWALSLLEQAQERLQQEMLRSGMLERFTSLEPLLTGSRADLRYRQLADQLGISESAVKVSVHRMRRRFGELLRELVAETVSAPEMVDEEIRYLFSVLQP